jgi:hypothetical protein
LSDGVRQLNMTGASSAKRQNLFEASRWLAEGG